jgi:RNA polymerase sigma factor for flagellar operon FliA
MNTLVHQYVGQQTPEELRERVLQYLPLVRYVVGRVAIHLPRHVDLEDLESVGVMGLMEATNRFDPNRGTRFKTFAYEHIRGAILGELRSRDLVSRPMRQKIRSLERAEAELASRRGGPPSISDLAREMDLDEDAIEQILLARHTHSVLSLDGGTPGGANGRSLLAGLVSGKAADPQEIAARREHVKLLADALELLSEVEQKVIVLYYSKGLLQRQIGEVLGVTESRVCQIHARAIARLRKILEESPEGSGDG